jgi:hypothetical protein
MRPPALLLGHQSTIVLHHTGSTTSKPNLYSAGPQSQRSPGLSIYEGTVLSIYEGIVSAVASESYPRYDISTYLSVRRARAIPFLQAGLLTTTTTSPARGLANPNGFERANSFES